jgi:hypothetical protein
MSAASAEEVTNKETAPWKKFLNDSIVHGQRFKRQMVWREESNLVSRMAKWIETAEPLPHPPSAEFDNVVAMNTIKENPDLFWVLTPINID